MGLTILLYGYASTALLVPVVSWSSPEPLAYYPFGLCILRIEYRHTQTHKSGAIRQILNRNIWLYYVHVVSRLVEYQPLGWFARGLSVLCLPGLQYIVRTAFEVPKQ